jgi:hypothetical protein
MWWPFGRLLEHWVGVSFRTFVNGLVSANPNDVYYNDRCAFFWGYYDDHHRGVRLPCSHIFGADCVIELFQSGDVQTCPICRTVWFRDPSLVVIARRCLSAICIRLFYLVLLMAIKIRSIWLSQQSRYPRTYLVLLMVHVLCSGNFYYLANYLVDNHTDLRGRNPDLNMTIVGPLFQFVRGV